MSVISGTYDYRLVSLSLVIAVVTSYTALDLGGRVRAHRDSARIAWLTGGALAMGSGIWSMHYIGMLALILPFQVYYHAPTVALSLAAAVLASLIALYVVSLDSMRPLYVASGCVLMGAAIAAMHYSGVAAMRLQAAQQHQALPWILSIALDIAASLGGILLISHTRDENRGSVVKMSLALGLGIAIAATHYTGMSAVNFIATGVAPDLTDAIDTTTPAVFAMLMVIALLLGIALVASLVDRRLSAQRSKLDDQRSMLRALIDNMPDYMYVKDLKSRFVIANPHLAQQVGAKSPEEMQGKTDFDYYPPKLAEAFFQDEQNLIQSGRPLYNREEKSIDGEGNEVDLLTTKVPIRDNKGQVIGFAGVGRDITDRKKIENALRETELKYRGIFDKANFGIYQSTPDGRLISVNPAMAFTFGYNSPEEMVEHVTDMSRQLFVNPKRGVEFMLVMDKVGGVKNFECEVFCNGGSKIWLNMSIRAIRENGVVVRYEGMCDDISERKLLQDQLLQAQKLESVGQLAAGIAHEINTPIQYIGDNVCFLKESFQDIKGLLDRYEQHLCADGNHESNGEIDKAELAAERASTIFLLDEIPKAIEQTLEGVTRVSTLVGAMKEFSHPGTKEKISVDLNHAIDSTIIVARNEWKYVANMETDLDTSLPLVLCQPGEFNQVILNMIVNAAHAIAGASRRSGAGKGTIRVQTRNCLNWAEIRIQDTGTGIPESVRPRIFDPFFTTKEIGKGTGQGLAIAHSVVVDKHKGSIHFETEEGKGTTFIIRLPYDGKSLPAKGVAA